MNAQIPSTTRRKNNNNLLRLKILIYVTKIGILKQRVKKIFRAR